MVKVASIWIRRAEGTTEECVETLVDGFALANKVVRAWSATAPCSGGYHKVDFVVTFEDGEQYEGRIDLTRFATVDIAKHMVDYLTFYAGVRRPSNITAESYERFILARGDKRTACIEFLGTYELRTAA